MSSSIATAWPSPGRFALALGLGFALTLAVAWAWGTLLIEAILPVTRMVLGWVDDRFVILSLGVDRDVQDTVVRLKVNLAQLFVMGGRVLDVHANGWLQVTTTTGAMLQPLVIAPAIAFALPGSLFARLGAVALAVLFAFAFLLLDLPLTLFAYVWDMMVENLDPDRLSPLLMWHTFLMDGGRLGVGVALGVAGVWLRRLSIGHRRKRIVDHVGRQHRLAITRSRNRYVDDVRGRDGPGGIRCPSSQGSE